MAVLPFPAPRPCGRGAQRSAAKERVMGQLVDGVWHDTWYDTTKSGGAFERSTAKFRNWITADGSTEFQAESGRYHLYVSLACPWAHRTLIFRKIKNLTAHISFDVVHPDMLSDGWTFESDRPGCDGRSAVWPAICPRYLSACGSKNQWSRHCSDSLGQAKADHCLKRELRNHTHVQLRL